jgi:hypothetical protein
MKNLIVILCFVGGCVTQVPQQNIDCQISCEYMKHLTGRDGQKGCEETREMILPDGEIVNCMTKCLEKNNHLCFTKAQTCNQVEEICQ